MVEKFHNLDFVFASYWVVRSTLANAKNINLESALMDTKGDHMHKRNLTLVVLVALTILAGKKAVASDYGIALGIRSDSATSNASGTSISANTDYQGGVVAAIEAISAIEIRTGLFYTSRQYGYTPATGASGTASFSYADIPVGLLWKLSDYGGPFVGANFGFNVASSCPTGSGICTGSNSVNSSITGYQFGVHFKFAPQFGAELYYEGMSAIVTGIDSAKAFAFNLFMTF
jgi:hypothetical protein